MIKAILNDRADAELHRIFPEGVPILGSKPELANLADANRVPTRELVFFVSCWELTGLRRRAMAEYVIAQCGGGEVKDVLEAIAAGVKIPLRASLVAEVLASSEAWVLVWRSTDSGQQPVKGGEA